MEGIGDSPRSQAPEKGLPPPPAQKLRLPRPPPQRRARSGPRAHPEDNVEAKQEVFPAAADFRVLEMLVLAGHGEC